MTMMTKTAAAGLAVALSMTMTSCSGGPDMQPKQARQEILTFVRDTANALGGDWKPRNAPELSKCPSGDGVTWVYVLDRSSTGDRSDDIARMERYLDDRDVETKRFTSAGADPVLGVEGHGGPLTSIEFYTDATHYTITGQSSCAEGDLNSLDPNDFS